MMTIPPGASPSPLSSVSPRRMSGPKLTVGHVLDPDRRSLDDLDGRLADVVGRLDVAATADDLLVAPHLDDATADLLVGGSHGAHDVVHGDLAAEQLVGVDVDLELLDEAAHARHLGHAGDAPNRVAQVPVLQRPQLGEVVLAARVDHGVLEHPADARRVGAEDWIEALAAGDRGRSSGTRARGCEPSRCPSLRRR